MNKCEWTIACFVPQAGSNVRKISTAFHDEWVPGCLVSCQSNHSLPSCFQIPSLLIFSSIFYLSFLATVLWGLCPPQPCSLSVSSCPVSSLLSSVLYYLTSSFLLFYWIVSLTSLQFPGLNCLSVVYTQARVICHWEENLDAIRTDQVRKWREWNRRVLCRISKFYQINWTQSQHRVVQAECLEAC